MTGVVTACGDGGGSGSALSRRCERIPAPKVSAIASGLQVSGGGRLRAARAVRSEDFDELYFISAELQASGLGGDDEIATWASNDLGVGGLTFAIDAIAQEFSDWPDGDTTDAELSMEDDGAEASRDCVRSALSG